MKKRVLPLTAIFLLVIVSGCNFGGLGDSDRANAKVAEGEGWVITRDDLTELYDSLPPEMAPLLISEEWRRHNLEQLILTEILFSEAQKEGITDEKEIIHQMEQARRKVAIEEYLRRKLEGGISLSTDEIEEFYEENREAFDSAKNIRVSYILLNSEEEAESVLKMLGEGKKFELLALECSICSLTGPTGGDFGYIKNEGGQMMFPEFDEAVLRLERPGDISPVVKTDYGYFIIKLTDKEHLLENHAREKQEELINRYINDLKNNTDYTIFDENFDF